LVLQFFNKVIARMSRGRGRGRGRIRFGGSHDNMLADLMDETREDLGLSHAQMEQLAVRTLIKME
jgi:hypothetical protein